jgi:putative DNA primase/helicase
MSENMPWDEDVAYLPEPLPPPLLPVPDLDLALLPAAIAHYCGDIARRQSSPIEFPAATMLVMMSAVVGTKIAVRPKRLDNWTVIPNLWGAVVASPAVMKTPSINEARKPFRKVEALYRTERDEELKPIRIEYRKRHFQLECDRRALKSLLEAKRKQVMNPTGKANVVDRETLDRMAESLEREEMELDAMRPQVSEEPCIEVNDATIEKLMMLQNNNPNGLLLFRDELTGMLAKLAKADNAGDRQYYLEAWAGDGSSVQHRVSRDTNRVENNCLSIFGSMQPGKLARLVREAGGAGDHADGMLQRFQVMVWSDASNTAQVDFAPDEFQRQCVEDLFMHLYRVQPADVDCHMDGQFPYLRLSERAAQHHLQWLNKREAQTHNMDDSLAQHLTKARGLAPALALLFHLAEKGRGDIPTATLERAIGVCEWLWCHAERVYAAGHYSHRSNLRRLAEHIRNGDLGATFTLRQVRRKKWTGIGKDPVTHYDNTEPLLAELVGMHWLQHIVEQNPKGGPASHLYVVADTLRDSHS